MIAMATSANFDLIDVHTQNDLHATLLATKATVVTVDEFYGRESCVVPFLYGTPGGNDDISGICGKLNNCVM
jgi:hypothetical protein